MPYALYRKADKSDKKSRASYACTLATAEEAEAKRDEVLAALVEQGYENADVLIGEVGESQQPASAL